MTPAFADAEAAPTCDMIREALGAADAAWAEFIRCLTDNGVAAEWRYYRDGGWLLKATRGRKTIAWASVEPSLFRVVFHIAERFRCTLIHGEMLSPELRQRISEAPQHGQMSSLSFEIAHITDIPDIVSMLKARLDAK